MRSISKHRNWLILYHRSPALAGKKDAKRIFRSCNDRNLWYNVLTFSAPAGQKHLLGALQTALLFVCEVIIPHPQIPQEFVGGFIRRRSAPAEPDDDKRNAMLKCLHFSCRILRPKVFYENLCSCVYYTTNLIARSAISGVAAGATAPNCDKMFSQASEGLFCKTSAYAVRLLYHIRKFL